MFLRNLASHPSAAPEDPVGEGGHPSRPRALDVANLEHPSEEVVRVRVGNRPGQWANLGPGRAGTATRHGEGATYTGALVVPVPRKVPPVKEPEPLADTCKYGHRGEMFRNTVGHAYCRRCAREAQGRYQARRKAA